MQLFYLINGWAGRSEWLDNALRFFYVGAVPLLMTALAAFLILAPRRDDELNYVASRRRLAFATFLTFGLCALVIPAVTLFQQQLLNGAPISPRPFMTHWVHALVVEPNDNSFPSFEVMFAAATATLLWASRPAAGVLAWGAVALLGFARIFCGMNYLADSLAGAVIGGGLSTFALAAWRVPLQLPTFKAGSRRLAWRVRHQAAFAMLSLIGFIAFAGYTLTTSPAHSANFKHFRVGAMATAAPSSTAKADSVSLALGIHEGEGGVLATESGDGEKPVAMSKPGELLLGSQAARLDGHLPEAEEYLAKALSTLAVPHRIVGVNVAQVRAGNSAYRCAAIRFEITESGSEERRAAAETAAQCVKRAFHTDAQLQHVDVLGIKLNYEPEPNSGVRPGARPIFTASVERTDLVVQNKPAWVNWSGLDGGAWLRARSALYIDPTVLPPAPRKPKLKQPAQPQTLQPQPAAVAPVPKAVTPVKRAVKRPVRRRTRKRNPNTRRRYRNSR